ncbi:hypothetical protein [Ferruginibacter sp. HRS2-29]|uniref:hypothetical protein n=1 Tax=Ferruginibacter sp. HRS2-29 TaxID=2487334 RepID=UPI0020CBAB5F|nr:hypothetical protein [Ferruginibacter sp. HRS2-29]MCP9750480.1 hypothetical protein [Ferruginibacter sp. HRS2-29]
MTIAAHIILSPKSDQNYLLDNIILWAKNFPEGHFILFADAISFAGALPAGNITPVLIKPAIKNNLSFYYWYNFKLPALLKRYDAHAFISESGAISFRTTVPQYLFLKESFFQSHDKNRYKKLLLKYFPRFAEKAATIFTTEKYITAALQKRFPQVTPPIFTPYHGLPEIYQPISWEEKEAVTAAFTSGNDYFVHYLSANTQHSVRMALKAFSIFKKWQKSSMKMVFLVDNVQSEGLVADIGSYKYRDEVLFIPAAAENRSPLLAAALAALYLPKYIKGENFGLNALQCNVPLIMPETEEAKMSFGNAALYAGSDETSIAEKMLLLYKDETLRKTLLESGNNLLLNYDLEKSASETWNIITNPKA